MLGNIIWICPLAPGTSADVLIWDGYGPSRTQGDFFDFQVGGHDGAYKGPIHVIVPFIGRKNGTLTARQQCYNVTMRCTGGIGHALSSCLLGCGTQDEAEDEAEVCVLCCQDAPPSQFVMSVRSTIVLNVLTPTLVGTML